MSKNLARALVCALVWLSGSLSAFTLLYEYPADVSGVLWRMYPGLFQWPLFFFPLCCLFVVRPLMMTWAYLVERTGNRLKVGLIFLGPIALGTFGMTTYEWFNGKPAVWEVSPAVSALPAAQVLTAAERRMPFAGEVGSFNQLALAVRKRASPDLKIPECRFSGSNVPAYRATDCFCAPIQQITNGGQCDALREIWVNALSRQIAIPGHRSLTYYTARLSFLVVAMGFLAGLVTVVYMSCFEDQMVARHPKEFEVARRFVQIFAIFCCVWAAQRFYLLYEQGSVFPSSYKALFVSMIFSAFLAGLVLLGTMYAFGLELNVVKSFHENLLAPVLLVVSLGLGAARPDLMATIFRVSFGVEASGPAIIGYVTFVIFVSLIPLLYWLKGTEFFLPPRPPAKPRRPGKRGKAGAVE